MISEEQKIINEINSLQGDLAYEDLKRVWPIKARIGFFIVKVFLYSLPAAMIIGVLVAISEAFSG